MKVDFLGKGEEVREGGKKEKRENWLKDLFRNMKSILFLDWFLF